jgi:hypothetical protein
MVTFTRCELQKSNRFFTGRRFCPVKKTNIFYGTNVLAMEALIEALWQMGRLEKVDSARVEICRLLARSVDEHPENANLWRQYREAEDVLTNGRR